MYLINKMNGGDFSFIQEERNNDSSSISNQNKSSDNDIKNENYIMKELLTDSAFEEEFQILMKLQKTVLDTIIYDMIQKKSYYKANNIIYNDISQKIKSVYKDKSFSINFLNNLISILAKNGQSADEILNEISYIYCAKKSLEFYSFKSIKDLILRTTKINKEQVPDKKLRIIYFEHKVLNNEYFLEKDYNTLRHLIDGPQQYRRPLDNDYGYYRYLPIQCKDYCQKSFSELYEALSENHKEYYEELKSDQNEFNSFVSDLKNHFLKNCIFAHNINEMSYHPLKYMTKYCKQTNCQLKGCSLVHEDKNEQLVMIFNKEQFNQIRKELTASLTKKNSITNNMFNPLYIATDNINNKANINLKFIKTIECKKKNICGIIKNCPFYHSILERRRNTDLFYIKNNKPCERVFVEGKWKNPKFCEKEDSCLFFHTRNELLYDVRNYKRLYECYIEKNKGVCEFYKICPYKHIVDVEVSRLYLPENEKNKIYELLKQYYSYVNDVKRLKQKLEKNNLVCNNCRDYIKDSMIIFSCGHNCCSKCINVMKNCYLMCLKLDGMNLQIDKDYEVIELNRNNEDFKKQWEFSIDDAEDFYDLNNEDKSHTEEQSWDNINL